MEEIKQFFAEVEFSDENNIYWYPVIIDAKNEIHAANVQGHIIKFLKNNFEVTGHFNPKPYIDNTYSDALRPYIENNSEAEIATIKLDILEINKIDGLEKIVLDKEIIIKPQLLLTKHKHSIESNLEANSFLATQYHEEEDLEKEYLILRINHQ